MKKLLAALILIGSIAPADDADAGNNRVARQAPAPMSTLGKTRPPIGYVQLCHDLPWECRSQRTSPVRVKLTRALLQDLHSVNSAVNRQIAPITDQDQFNRPEVWTYPTTQGDCEDYVLLKRRILMQRGWPESALLITVVREANGNGHAVLTVTTSAGDLVLDNQHAQVRDWRDTPYRFIKRQSQSNPVKWVSLGRGRPQVSNVADTLNMR